MVNLDSLFMNDLVSIIVPVYNSSPYLKDICYVVLCHKHIKIGN